MIKGHRGVEFLTRVYILPAVLIAEITALVSARARDFEKITVPWWILGELYEDAREIVPCFE